MKSPRPFDLRDFDNGFAPRQAGDAWEQPPLAPMTLDEYLAFLARQSGPSYEELAKKDGPRGPPFRLP